MDPHRNQALSNAKLQTILQALIQSTPQPTSATAEDMPAPPSYHSVVNPMAPIPNMHSPYDPEDEDDEEDKDEDETPDITINAATQIRGNGNIISITQMDSVRIAGLIGTMLYGPQPAQASAPRPPAPKAAKQFPKFNITVNCGATIIGDRNIVGPGLGDIARQMQASQRNQALQAQAKGSAATAPVCSQNPTPPLSLTSGSESGVKRKAEDEWRESVGKKQR